MTVLLIHFPKLNSSGRDLEWQILALKQTKHQCVRLRSQDTFTLDILVWTKVQLKLEFGLYGCYSDYRNLGVNQRSESESAWKKHVTNLTTSKVTEDIQTLFLDAYLI